MLILLFAEALRLAPAGGFPGWQAGPGPALAALTLPAVALAVPQAAVLARVLRAELIAAQASDYALAARARGLGEGEALLRHALPNALPPALTVLGLQVAFLLAGGVVVETLFALPGLGRLVYQAVEQRDLIVVQGAVLVLVAGAAVASFLADLAAAAFDPRLAERRT
jgi:peptide/nickel transport system permease protein